MKLSCHRSENVCPSITKFKVGKYSLFPEVSYSKTKWDTQNGHTQTYELEFMQILHMILLKETKAQFAIRNFW